MLPPNSVQKLLDWWFPQVRELSTHLHSVILFGSVTFDDFNERWSDVDACVALDTPLTDDEGQRIGSLHEKMGRLYLDDHKDGWESGQALEAAYASTKVLSDPDAGERSFVAGERGGAWTGDDPFSPFDRYVLAHFGVPWFGQRVPVAAPTRQALVSETRADLSGLTPEAAHTDSPIWLCGMMHWLARSIVFWRDEEMSRTAALEREIASGSPLADAFSLALRLRKEGSAATHDHVDELRAQFERIAEPGAEL